MEKEDFYIFINKAMMGGMNKDEIIEAMVDEIIKWEDARWDVVASIDDVAWKKYGAEIIPPLK